MAATSNFGCFQASWPTVPLSQATTLCGSETPSSTTDESAAKSSQTLASVPPILPHLHEAASHSSAALGAQIQDDQGRIVSDLQTLRSNDWVIVGVSAYCLFYQIFACTLFTPVLAFRLKDIGVIDVEETAGYLSSLWAGGCVIMSPIAGWLPTIYKDKRVQLIAYISLLLVATLLFAFVPNVKGLMAGRFLHGLAASGAWTVAMALLNDNVNPNRLGRMTGVAQVGYAIGNSASPTMGGPLYAKLGWLPLCYFALALGGLNILVCLIYLEKSQVLRFGKAIGADELENKLPDDASVELQSAMPPLRAVLSICFGNPKYLIGIAMGLCWGAVSNGVLYTALPLRLENRFGLDTASIGYSFLAIAGPNIVLAPLAGWMTDRLGARPLILACLGSFAIWNSLMCIDSLPYTGFLVVLVGIGASASFVATPILVYWTTVDRLYGSPVGGSIICGIYSTAVSVSCLVLPLVSGSLLGKFGVSLGWKILLGIVTACFVSCLAFVYTCMRLPQPELGSVRKPRQPDM